MLGILGFYDCMIVDRLVFNSFIRDGVLFERILRFEKSPRRALSAALTARVTRSALKRVNILLGECAICKDLCVLTYTGFRLGNVRFLRQLG